MNIGNGLLPGYLTIPEAAKAVGMNERALLKRVRRGVVPRYADPRDRRKIILKESDVKTLLLIPIQTSKVTTL